MQQRKKSVLTKLAAVAAVLGGALFMIVPADAQIVSGTGNVQETIQADEGPAGGLVNRKAAVNGIRIHYLRAGQGPAVVLLHG